MGEIRFLGRARGGRCVYCHDSLSSEVQTCAECSATWHADCGESARRCPTVGCSGPAPSAASRPGRRRARPRTRPPAPRPSAVGDSTGSRRQNLDPDRPRPGFFARVGPYSRLLVSAVFTAAIAGASSAFLLWPVLRWGDFWEHCHQGEDGARHSAPVAALIAMVLIGLALLASFFTCRWLLRVPGVLREVGLLLADTRPTAMRLTARNEGDSESTKWVAKLVGAGTSLSFSLGGLLPPGWIRSAKYVNEPVLVYGLPPPGPYVIEFRDGSLALVHPD